MKTLIAASVLAFSFVSGVTAQEYIEDTVQVLEDFINQSYTGRARAIALKRLDDLLSEKGTEAERKKKLDAYRKHLLGRIQKTPKDDTGHSARDLDGDGRVGVDDPAPLIAGNGGLLWHAQSMVVVISRESAERSFRFAGAIPQLLKDKQARKAHPLSLMGYDPISLSDRAKLMVHSRNDLLWNDANKLVFQELRAHLANSDLAKIKATIAVDLSFFNCSNSSDYSLDGDTLPVLVNDKPLFVGRPVEKKPFVANTKYATLVRFAGAVGVKDLVDALDDMENGGVSVGITGGDLEIFNADRTVDWVRIQKSVGTHCRRLSVRTHSGLVDWRVAIGRKGNETTVGQALVAINRVVRKRNGRDLFTIAQSGLTGIAGVENALDRTWVPFVGTKKLSSKDMLKRVLPDRLEFVLVNKKQVYANFNEYVGSLNAKSKAVAYLKTHAPKELSEWRLAQRTGVPEAFFLIAECAMHGVMMTKDLRLGAERHLQAASLGLSASMNRIGEMYRVGMGVKMDDKRAFKWFLKASEKGDPAGLDNLARCYFYGLGVKRDVATAGDLFKLAADKGHAFAQYSYANLLFAKRDFKAALPYFKKSADGGCAVALVRLGDVYRQGLGVEVNYEKAIEVWRRAAELNETGAYYYLAQAYENGWGVEVDVKKAISLYEKAWSSGDWRVGNHLAQLYATGKGVEKNPSKALKIYKVGVERGDAKAMIAMAQLLVRGDGVSADQEKAEKLLIQAADKGMPDALTKVGDMYYYGEGVKKSMQKAFKYYSLGKEKGGVEALVRVGWMYETGQGVEADLQKAFDCYSMAAKSGNVEGIRRTGVAYLMGLGVEVDKTKAFGLIKKAHDAGDATASYLLVEMYEEGTGVKKSHRKSVELVKIAADRGDPAAQNYLGYLYFSGSDGYPKDMKKAFGWYKNAANGGNVKAMFNVGYMYENGHGVGRNLVTAKTWYSKAAKAGSRAAKKALLRLKVK